MGQTPPGRRAGGNTGDVGTLVQMGFTPAAAQAALRASNGDVSLAVEQLAGPSTGTVRTSTPRTPPAWATRATNQPRVSPREVVAQCAVQLSPLPESVDILITSVGRVLAFPEDPKYRRVALTNAKFRAHVADAPGGIELLEALGYKRQDQLLVLGSFDAQLLAFALERLEDARRSRSYQDARSEQLLVKALQESEQEWTEAERARRARAERKVPREPPDGAAGNTLLCIHLGESSAESRNIWRRFESCNTLEEVAAFVESRTPFQVGVNAELVDVTMAAPRKLDKACFDRTLQALDLWPSGHIRVNVLVPQVA